MKSIAELAREAERLAAELRETASTQAVPEGSGQKQGSAHRLLPESLRRRVIDFRGELFDRGIYDPVLVRFDTATAPQAETGKIADRLAEIAQSLTI